MLFYAIHIFIFPRCHQIEFTTEKEYALMLLPERQKKLITFELQILLAKKAFRNWAKHSFFYVLN